MTESGTDARQAPGASGSRYGRLFRCLRLRPPRASRPPRLSRMPHPPRLSRLSRLPQWWPVALCLLIGVLAGGCYGLLRTPQYTATSYVAVVPGEGADPVTALGFAQAYGRIATGGAVLHRAQSRAGLDMAALEGGVRAVTSPDAPLIEISGSGTHAGKAATVANAVANSLTEVANTSAKSTGVRLTLFSSARTPGSPSSPTAALSAAVGGCAGGLVGGLLLLVRPRRDVRTSPAAVPAPAAGEAAPQPERVPDGERAKEGAR